MIKIKLWLYRVWYWIGKKMWFFGKYNIERDTQMEKTKKTLHKSLNPKLLKLLKDEGKDK